MNELKAKFPNASQAFRLRNPEIFSAPVGPIQGAERKQDAAPALDRKVSRKGSCHGRMAVCCEDSGPFYRITLIAFQRKLQDSDNTIAGLKDLRDKIATWLGTDDSDKLIQWEYGQVQTRGEEGVAVRIEKL